MNKFKLYLYSAAQEANGYRGTDYSVFIQQGLNTVEDLTEELDTAEITLVGLTQKESFAPTTKFILDVVGESADGYEETRTTHWIVGRDFVEQPILSDDNYFTHRISLIEPSVVAQKRVVDNIAATYKLKDVSLEEKSSYPDNAIQVSLQTPNLTPPYGQFGIKTTSHQPTSTTSYDTYSFSYGKYFALENNAEASVPLALKNINGEIIKTEYIDIADIPADTDGKHKASFLLPRLAMMTGSDKSTAYKRAGNVSIDWSVAEYASTDLANPTNVASGTVIANALLYPSIVGEYLSIRNGSGTVLPQSQFIVEDYVNRYDGTPGGKKIFLYKQYSTPGASDPTYSTEMLEIKAGRKYVVTISLHQYSDPLPSGAFIFGVDDITPELYTGTPSQFFYFEYSKQTSIMQATVPDSIRRRIALSSQYTTAQSAAEVYELDGRKIAYASAIPYSALTLLQKAVLNSGTYSKKSGVVASDVNRSDTPFYIDPDFVDELAATQIIENFYNQKNLWQIMLEVGYYIHAIPELRFGADDKFLITFNRLGRTDVVADTATKMSIFNSRSVEDYISATTSYVSNMVQLGGKVGEWVAPKTTAETLLISNDTADIIVSRPIIELLKITVKCNSDKYTSIKVKKDGQDATVSIPLGATADMTQFVYERNVYNTLGIEASILPNRSFALYYDLGKNVITGGNYQLPQANVNLNSDYAFKKVIFSAYFGYDYALPSSALSAGYWCDIKVSDFTFYVEYRTKDSVRQSHVRPDLRKYLLASKHDRCPEQVQFNNQQDVVVDSVKFGNNLYGKLIRTGNNSYQKTEWSENLSQLKHKGELCRINNELYYVAKANHYYYATYVMSEVSFSKDYNELSKVVGIPSEPRFYEISEQSLIRREVDVRDFLLLTTDGASVDNPNATAAPQTYILDLAHTVSLIFGTSTDFARYALTVFKGDKNVTFADIGAIGRAELYLEVMHSINAYSSQNTLTYSWKMLDNYSAGDQVIDCEVPANAPVDTTAYKSLWAVKYTDIYGKSALMDFYLLGNKGLGDLTQAQISALPKSPLKTKTDVSDTRPYVGSKKNTTETNYDIYATNATQDTDYNGRGIVLLKDCREAISMNYNLQLITDSDTFVLSPFVFSPNKKNVYLVLLSEEVNKLSDGYISDAKMIAPFNSAGTSQINKLIPFNFISRQYRTVWDVTRPTSYTIAIPNALANVNAGHFNGAAGFEQVKAMAVVCNVAVDASGEDVEEAPIPYKTKFVIARNLPSDWTAAKKQENWYIGAPYKTIFRETQ